MGTIIAIYVSLMLATFAITLVTKVPVLLVRFFTLPAIPFIWAYGHWSSRRGMAVTVTVLYSTLYLLLVMVACLEA